MKIIAVSIDSDVRVLGMQLYSLGVGLRIKVLSGLHSFSFPRHRHIGCCFRGHALDVFANDCDVMPMLKRAPMHNYTPQTIDGIRGHLKSQGVADEVSYFLHVLLLDHLCSCTLAFAVIIG